MERATIDPAFGLELVHARTLEARCGRVSVVIPAYNERDTVGDVVAEARRGLAQLGVDGEVVVSASGCTDDTADVAEKAGARVMLSAIGKGAAIRAGVAATDGDIVCLVDGDFSYFGEKPLAATLVEPILNGVADATVADLYWRPVYPQI